MLPNFPSRWGTVSVEPAADALIVRLIRRRDVIWYAAFWKMLVVVVCTLPILLPLTLGEYRAAAYSLLFPGILALPFAVAAVREVRGALRSDADLVESMRVDRTTDSITWVKVSVPPISALGSVYASENSKCRPPDYAVGFIGHDGKRVPLIGYMSRDQAELVATEMGSYLELPTAYVQI